MNVKVNIPYYVIFEVVKGDELLNASDIAIDDVTIALGSDCDGQFCNLINIKCCCSKPNKLLKM